MAALETCLEGLLVLERHTRDLPPRERERRAREKETTRRTGVFVLGAGTCAVAAASALKHICFSQETHTRDWTHLERYARERKRRHGAHAFLSRGARAVAAASALEHLSLCLFRETHTRDWTHRER